jgi:Family of unknown function (DUF6338)
VPGVVALFVRSKFVTGRSPSLTENALTFLVLSLLCYALVAPFIETVLSVRGPFLARALVWISLILVGPAALGLLLGVAAQKEWGDRIANRFGLSLVHVIPAAWDWRFSKVPRGGVYIMVTLANGDRIPGWFGTNSFRHWRTRPVPRGGVHHQRGGEVGASSGKGWHSDPCERDQAH